MPDKCVPDGETNQPMIHQFCIKGYLDRQWEDRFEELCIMLEDNSSALLTGPVVDQAALHGIIRKIRDLEIVLLSVNSIPGGSQDSAEVE